MAIASISRGRTAGASALLLVVSGCGAPRGIDPADVPVPDQPRVIAPLPLGSVFVLEASGGQPEDTTVALEPGVRRVIVLRRSGPDYGIFARLELPDSGTTTPAGAGALRLTLKPRPGLYALDLEVTGAALQPGASITFSYGAHFVAPGGARSRYGSNLAFEKELAVGRLGSDGRVVFLPTSRPGTDMVSAPLAGPGRYLVGAPH